MKTAGGQKSEGEPFYQNSCFYWYSYVCLAHYESPLQYKSEIYLASYKYNNVIKDSQHNIH